MIAHPAPPAEGDDPEVRRNALEHLRACAACREGWLAGAPERVFALLDGAPIPDGILDEVASGVLEEARGARASGMSRRAVAWAAGIAMAAMLVGLGVRPPADELARVHPRRAPAARAGVDLLDSPGAGRIVDLTVGNAQVVMIFDSEIEL